MTTVRLPKEVVDYLREHPEIKPAKLIERLARLDLGMEPSHRKSKGNQFNIKLSPELQYEITKQRKHGIYYMRALLKRYIDRQNT